MTALRRAAFALLVAVSLFAPPPATATSYSTDQSDLWWADPPASENGWGFQLVQRGSVIFATVFVYGPTGAPTWYVATMGPADGQSTWSGDLYTTTGPWFGAMPYNPALFTFRKVGTMTWVAQSSTAGTLTYDVDGLTIVKNVTRQTLVLDDYSGTYLGAFHASVTACTNPGGNGSGEIPIATFTVSQNGSSISITFAVPGFGSMTISGTLTQSGQFGAVTGTYSDTTGDAGTASISTLNVQTNSLVGTFTQDSATQGCHAVGYFAAMRSRP
jgi:hypothetical protein